jgi:hypothetical protein
MLKRLPQEKARQGEVGEKSDIFEHSAGAFSSYSLRVGYRNSSIPKSSAMASWPPMLEFHHYSLAPEWRIFLDARDASALQACGSPLLRGIIPNRSELKVRGDVAKLAYAQDLKS